MPRPANPFYGDIYIIVLGDETVVVAEVCGRYGADDTNFRRWLDRKKPPHTLSKSQQSTRKYVLVSISLTCSEYIVVTSMLTEWRIDDAVKVIEEKDLARETVNTSTFCRYSGISRNSVASRQL
ncbi:hypothetical protein RvY_06677 [Ramazzottius varieornatus]|uniref:Uncharacterized protein n=1 Tax=Ramazzottius varieornatus TaxID=947166 RepID=A0A1D1V830_RAMVA|nr:hypothetical protein RvY_06677 [Ramazzottius varieornatus]